MPLFTWKGPKPTPALSDAGYAAVTTQFASFVTDSRAADVEIAVVAILAARMGDGFTPEIYGVLKIEADEIASLLSNDAFSTLDANQTWTMIMVHFTAFLDALGFEAPSVYGIENVVARMVMGSLLLAQMGRGFSPPSKEEIDIFRDQVNSLLGDAHSLLPRDDAAPIVAALAVASKNHVQAVKVYSGGGSQDLSGVQTA